jgi:hypothetical protein
MMDQKLNETIARKLGWRDVNYRKGVCVGFPPNPHLLGVPDPEIPYVEIPDFTKTIEAAWMVMEAILERIPKSDIHLEHLHGAGWRISTCYEEKAWKDWVTADTAPMAICQAFLKLP